MPSWNIASAVYELAASQPEVLALALPSARAKAIPSNGNIPYQEYSYLELARQTNLMARGLLESGFEPGDKVVMMVPPGLEFFTLSFAMLQTGIIPVLIDPGIGIKNLKKCIETVGPVGFIGINKAHLARILLGWGRATIRKKASVGSNWPWAGKPLKSSTSSENLSGFLPCFEANSDDLAAILFTSGSTGISKGVMYTHGNFRCLADAIRTTYQVKPGEIDLPTFPPFALFNPAAGMSSIIPDMDPTRPAHVNPEKIISAIQQYNITSMFGSPALIDRVGRYGLAHGIKLPSLRRVFSAGAPVSAEALKRFSTMLSKDTPIYTPYGATEAMPITSINSHHILLPEIQQKTAEGAGICIGKPVHSVDVRIIRISDTAIDHWAPELEADIAEVGEIVVSGGNVTRSYYNLDHATRLAKIADGAHFWHRMGDLGYKDNDGNFWFCGRKSDRITLGNKTLYSVPCESLFNKHPKVYRTALVSVESQPVLCVEIDPEIRQPDKAQIKKELLEWAARSSMTSDIKTILFHPGFPVDIRHNSKISRDKLAVWASNTLSGKNRFLHFFKP